MSSLSAARDPEAFRRFAGRRTDLDGIPGLGRVNSMEKIFIYGAGGQGKVVIDGLEAGPQPFAVGFIVDDDFRLQGEKLRGHPITSPEVIRGERGIVAIGDNEVRMAIAARYPGKLVSVVHPRAWIAPEVQIGAG